MMLERIDKEIKEAMKNKDPVKLETLRMLKSTIKYFQIQEKLEKVSDEDVLNIIQKEIKKRKETMDEALRAERNDIANPEIDKIAILEKFLPEAISEKDLLILVDEAILSTGAAGQKDMGKVMKILISQLKGRVDSTLISKVVKEKLNK
ncbi:MAG: GatB/YqeY domain-containing protein [Candidatus Coatesbacteria bacterium]|nr:GatB/YqeY domain-containing protein [Candidatus Coatesbacteria bacterium]